MEKRKINLRLGTCGSVAAMIRICLFGCLGMLASSLLSMWLNLSWLVPAAAILYAAAFVLEGIILPLGCRVQIDGEVVSAQFFGLTLRRIPLSRVKGIVLTEGYMDQGLCLSTLTMAEAAQRREKALLRHPYYRSGVTYRKTRPDWERDFTREYFGQMRGKTFLHLRDRNSIWMEFDIAILPALRQIFPQAQRYDLRPAYHHRQRGEENARVLCCGLEPTEHTVEFHGDGVHVVRKRDRKMAYMLPGAAIRTVIRTEHYSTSRYVPTRTRYLAVSTRTVEELTAEELARCGAGAAQWLPFPEGEEILTIHQCEFQLHRWSGYAKGFCAFPDTPEQADALRHICPDARWIEG